MKTGQLTTRKTKSCGCLRKKYHKDENFFEKIDSEEKAYTLGFIAADGSVNIKNGLIKIEQKSENDDILEKIAKALKYDNLIKNTSRKRILVIRNTYQE